MTGIGKERLPLDDLYWRAEILQALYWLRGERLADEVEPHGLADFLQEDGRTVAAQLERLVGDGYLERRESRGSPPAYRLTELGLVEGGRSFRDEFDEVIARGHFVCAPGCSCEDPAEPDESCPSRSPDLPAGPPRAAWGGAA